MNCLFELFSEIILWSNSIQPVPELIMVDQSVVVRYTSLLSSFLPMIMTSKLCSNQTPVLCCLGLSQRSLVEFRKKNGHC